MRIVFIGTVEFSRRMLEELIRLRADVAGVVTKARSDFNADFADLAPLCRKHGIPYLRTQDVNASRTVRWIKGLRPDIVFCFGFSQLLKQDILRLPRMGVIGYHPALLPRNRGRHPIIWALVLGLKRTGSTFFFMTGGADDGDILSQREVRIGKADDAAGLYGRITAIARRQVREFLPRLIRGTYRRTPQDGSRASYWRKRIESDGQIDFRMSARSICALVRALSRPYIGAHLRYGDAKVTVWAAKERRGGLPDVEHGKVLAVGKRGEVTVKCADGAVTLTDHGFKRLPKKGEYLV